MSERVPAYAGIDPGVGGALVVVDAAGRVVHCTDTPTISVATSGKTKAGKAKLRSEYDVAAMVEALSDVCLRWDVRRVVIEKIHAMPGKRAKKLVPGNGGAPEGEGHGSIAAVNLAEGCGLWRGICATLGLPVVRVSPQTWKARMVGNVVLPSGLSRSRRSALLKERSRARALELFPEFAGQLRRKSDHGRAEAALLAEDGRRLG